MTGILVHEWLSRSGGSENVFETLAQAFPTAERWCLWNDAGERFAPIHETVLASTPLRRHKAIATPFMPLTWRTLPSRQADWILISSHLFAHHARFGGPARDAPKLVYTHTPARYIWAPELDARGSHPLARLVAPWFKRIDANRAKEPVAIAANSSFIASRIRKSWGRDAEVIYPPIQVADFKAAPSLTPLERSQMAALPPSFLLGVSRFIPYKRLDHTILTGQSADMPVVLAGRGPDLPRLKAFADATYPRGVTFLENPSTALLINLYHRASAVVFAPVEDFGIVPVEAMAAGTPVVANAVGGAAESVIDGVTGALVHDWNSATERASAVHRALACSPTACVARAEHFDRPLFIQAMQSFVERNTVGVHL